MIDLLGYVAVALGAAVSGAALWDRIQKHRRRIGRDAKFSLVTPLAPAINNWTERALDHSQPERVQVEVTLYNNSDEPVVIEEWKCQGPPLQTERVPVSRQPTTMAPGQTIELSKQLLPDWSKWAQSLEVGRTSPDDGEVRFSLIVLFRASSRRESIRLEKYTIPQGLSVISCVAGDCTITPPWRE